MSAIYLKYGLYYRPHTAQSSYESLCDSAFFIWIYMTYIILITHIILLSAVLWLSHYIWSPTDGSAYAPVPSQLVVSPRQEHTS